MIFKFFLISKNYIIVMICLLLEYWLEIIFFLGLKEYWWISNCGFVMVIIGEIVRKMVMVIVGCVFIYFIKI